ncbi:MAG: cytidylyltransferase domain-containing protein [Spirochaetota bacterium]
MKKDCIVLQVRLRSRRLPGKLILPLKGGVIFYHVLSRLCSARRPNGVIVATTDDTLPYIEDIARNYGVEIITGSEKDVLGRFAQAVRRFNIANLVRATGDNPLVCIDYIDRTLELHRASGADLTTFPGLPYGTGVEVVSGPVLMEIERLATSTDQREHITRYIYQHDDTYLIEKGIAENHLKRPEVRLTVDTPEDYKRMKKIYQDLYRERPIKLDEVIEYWDHANS